MPSAIFNSCLLDAFRGKINFEGDAFGVMLLSSEYAPDKTHARRADLQAYEITAEGYDAGGTEATVVIQGAEDDAVDILLGGARWRNASISARYAAYYKRNAGSADEDELVAVIDFAQDVISTKGTFALSDSTLRLQN